MPFFGLSTVNELVDQRKVRFWFGSVALLVARRTNDRRVEGSRPTKVVCITVLPGWGELPAVAGRQSFFRAVGSRTVSIDGLGPGTGKW